MAYAISMEVSPWSSLARPFQLATASSRRWQRRKMPREPREPGSPHETHHGTSLRGDSLWPKPRDRGRHLSWVRLCPLPQHPLLVGLRGFEVHVNIHAARVLLRESRFQGCVAVNQVTSGNPPKSKLPPVRNPSIPWSDATSRPRFHIQTRCQLQPRCLGDRGAGEDAGPPAK